MIIRKMMLKGARNRPLTTSAVSAVSSIALRKRRNPAVKKEWNPKTSTWYNLDVSPKELRLDVTLTNGQCFNWKSYPPLSNDLSSTASYQQQYFGVLGTHVFLLKQTNDGVYYRLLNEEMLCKTSKNHIEESKIILRDYFQLNVNIEDLYKRWCEKADDKFKDIAESLYGMRILRQDPVECLFSFLCSSCNNIARITQMLDSLRKEYGELLYTDPQRGIECYSFPTIDVLDKLATEERLRELGMGYRAVFIKESARELNQAIELTMRDSSNDSKSKLSEKCEVTVMKFNNGVEYLHALRNLDRTQVTRELTYKADKKKLAAGNNTTRLGLTGVGPKVADCIALFSLDQTDCVPVDTHVIQIAIRDFDDSLKNVSLTKKVHERVGNMFRDCYGPYAGWAHSILFAAELPQFEHKLPEHIVVYIKKFKDLCKERNAMKKLEKKKKREAKRMLKQASSKQTSSKRMKHS